MRVAFFELTAEEKGPLEALAAGLEASFTHENLSPANVSSAAGAEAVSVFINSMMGKDIIDALPGLKLIVTRSTGFDHIDVAYAKSRGITVAHVPAYGSHTVAEFAFALLLTMTRKIFTARHQLMEGEHFGITGLRGTDLFGRTIGVLGTGRIGKNVVRIAKGFGMNVLAFDVFPDQAFAGEQSFSYLPLEDVLRRSDFITVHLPYTKETFHLLSEERFAMMKTGAYLVNTARGEIVDTPALLKALTGGRLAGAGLDVLEAERQLKEEVELLKEGALPLKDFRTLFEDHVLMDLPSVIVTPHIAFYTADAQREILETAVENIRAFSAGTPKNIVQT